MTKGSLRASGQINTTSLLTLWRGSCVSKLRTNLIHTDLDFFFNLTIYKQYIDIYYRGVIKCEQTNRTKTDVFFVQLMNTDHRFPSWKVLHVSFCSFLLKKSFPDLCLNTDFLIAWAYTAECDVHSTTHTPRHLHEPFMTNLYKHFIRMYYN